MSIIARALDHDDSPEETPRFPVDNLFEWQRLFMLYGPESTTTMTVLFVLGTHMNKKGICWPSQDRIAAKSRLCVRAVRNHLKVAQVAGWIQVTSKRRAGAINSFHCYQASVPDYCGEDYQPKKPKIAKLERTW